MFRLAIDIKRPCVLGQIELDEEELLNFMVLDSAGVEEMNAIAWNLFLYRPVDFSQFPSFYF